MIQGYKAGQLEGDSGLVWQRVSLELVNGCINSSWGKIAVMIWNQGEKG